MATTSRTVTDSVFSAITMTVTTIVLQQSATAVSWVDGVSKTRTTGSQLAAGQSGRVFWSSSMSIPMAVISSLAISTILARTLSIL